jgi:WS/DGAT/MGAT family acyltransferase
MRQLNALDNLMIGGELANIPMHISAVMLYDTAGKRGAKRLFDSLENDFGAIIDQHFPILRCRLDEVALQLDKAYWVEDTHFSLSYHINRVALPKPQNWQEFYRLIGQFHAQPLDRARPLWQVLFVEGLDALEGIPRGSTAVFFKIHHAVMDGKSALRLASSFHSLDPEPGAPTLAEGMPIEEPVDKAFRAPSWWTKYGRAWWHSIERPVDLAATLLKLIPQVLQTDHSTTEPEHQPIPQLHFNHPVAADRITGHVRMSMKQLRRLEKKYHCTINDVALCVIGGALRNYLRDRKELPEENLQTLMPIDIRRKGSKEHTGNQVSAARLCLYTNVNDAKERLQAISKASSHTKKRTKKGDPHALLNLVDDIHPAIILWLGQWLVNSGQIDKLPQLVNTVVTNVPGMRTEVYLAGAKLIDYLGYGPLAPNMGLFHTVSSTPDHVNISFLSTNEFMGDGSAYRAALAQSYAEVSRQ